jgi:hypothetical protein
VLLHATPGKYRKIAQDVKAQRFPVQVTGFHKDWQVDASILVSFPAGTSFGVRPYLVRIDAGGPADNRSSVPVLETKVLPL